MENVCRKLDLQVAGLDMLDCKAEGCVTVCILNMYIYICVMYIHYIYICI